MLEDVYLTKKELIEKYGEDEVKRADREAWLIILVIMSLVAFGHLLKVSYLAGV